MTNKHTTRKSTSHHLAENVSVPVDTNAATAEHPTHVAQNATAPGTDLPAVLPEEKGGQAGLEPTRYGDWEKKGRCTDF